MTFESGTTGNGINAGNGSRLNVLASVISFNTVGVNQTGLGAGASTAMVAAARWRATARLCRAAARRSSSGLPGKRL